jgi:hypothetical protein
MTLPGLLNRRDRMLLAKMNMLFEGADSVEPCETDLFGYFVWFSAAWTSRTRRLVHWSGGTGYSLICEREFTSLLLLAPFPGDWRRLLER